MSDARASPEPGDVEGSQLGTWRRLRHYIRRPQDAFRIVSSAERRRDALLVLVLYFVVRVPVVLQRSVALGRLDRLEAGERVLALGLGLGGGIVCGAASLLLAGLLLHLVVNGMLGAGQPRGEAVRLPTLCLAPQLILVAEFPSLLFDFRGYSTFLAFLVLRIAADVLSLRMFYWGLRLPLGLRPRQALAVTLAPVALVLLVTLATLPSLLR